MAEAVVSIVVGRLTDLLTEESQPLHEVTAEIQQVVDELTKMKKFLPDADSRLNEPKVKILVGEVRELAYDAEHVVETFLLKALSTGSTIQWFDRKTKKFSRKIKDIQKRMSLLFDGFRDNKIKSTSDSPSSSSGLKRFYSFATPEPEFFVGFQRDADLLIQHLVNDSDDCYKLVSICGMGGLGKTTLARKIYNHSTIKTCFSGGLAWVAISQKLQKELVLRRILVCLDHGNKEEILTWDYDKLVENLLEIQQRKKCFIVLDDIWSTDAWDSLKAAFPAEKCASKLMLTSRNVHVAEHADAKGFIHQPECLSEEESWELLRLKALPTAEYCLDSTGVLEKMEELGRKLVAYCAGLPLAIIMLGGILVTKLSLIEWEKVYKDSVFSGLGKEHQSQLSEVLNRSYDDLPSQLKPCFLYLGKYGEDESIDAERLYQLWIAEGMVLSSDKREGETMMQVAESYLRELVHKSMVQVKFNDGQSYINFGSCSLHDLMRDLSVSRAAEEGFFKVIDLREDNDFNSSPKVDITRGLVLNFYEDGKSDDYFGKKADHQRYRSILLFTKLNTKSLPSMLESHVANFRLLKVFSLKVEVGISFKNIGKVLDSLVYLRYLSVSEDFYAQSCDKLRVFPSIPKLVLLETLRLEGPVQTDFTSWPSENILSMLKRLRHLYLPIVRVVQYWRHSCLPSVRVQNKRKNFKLRFIGLSKLETLVNFNSRWCEVKDLPQLISLQKLTLRVWIDDMEEMMENLAAIALSSSSCLRYLALEIYTCDDEDKMADLLRRLLWDHNFNLQELTIVGRLPELAHIFEQRPGQFLNTHFNVSQTRITRLMLFGSRLMEDPMPVLEKIATLRQLFLGYETFLGKEMICSATGFPKLTTLYIKDAPDLETWRVEKGSMPVLSNLIVEACHKLEELPEGLVFLNSLQTLWLYKMPSDLCDQLRKANGEQGPQFYKVAHIPSFDMRY